MITVITILGLFVMGLTINFPMTRKPLSEDDGNWYYPAIFWERGVRPHKNYIWAYGYFSVTWMAAKLYNLCRIDKYSFFYYFKIMWYSLTSLSVYWIAFCFYQNHILSLIAGITFLLITSNANTLFFLTYGEHFFILPINLSIIFINYGLSTNILWYFAIAGLMAAWAVQIKPTALLFAIVLPVISSRLIPRALTNALLHEITAPFKLHLATQVERQSSHSRVSLLSLLSRY